MFFLQVRWRVDHPWFFKRQTLIDFQALVFDGDLAFWRSIDRTSDALLLVNSCQELVPPLELLNLAIELFIAVLSGRDATLLTQMKLH